MNHEEPTTDPNPDTPGTPPGTDSPDPPGEPDQAKANDADPRPVEPNAAPAPALPPFTPERLFNELWIDMAIRRALAGLVIVAAACLIVFKLTNSAVGLAAVMGLTIGWIGLNSISANIWRTLPQVTAMIGHNPAAAEAELAQLIKRRPLMRWVRLMLYHRLASIRHRQHRFHESAAICQAVLSQPLGPARKQRGPLLLMLTEARLHCGDLAGAYTALFELHQEPQTLVESLQRLTLQTRYEVLAGHDRAALAGVRQKLLLSELMPSDHCGAMHAMLTTSAKRTGQLELADWLWRRSNLLCSPEQLQRLVTKSFAIRVVAPPDPNG